jgi:predicted TIM-barrel fold metal-dependent hydrolase
MYDGPVVDPHVHLQLDDLMSTGIRPERPEDYLKASAQFDLRAAGVLVVAPPGDIARTRTQNDLVLELASESPFYAMCSVHPSDGDRALEEVERVAAAGASGLKLHPNTQAFDVADEAVHAVVERAGGLGLPVLFDAYSPFDADQPGKFLGLALSCPSTQIILAHMHHTRFLDLLVYDVMAKYPWWTRNVWFDMSVVAPAFAESPYRDQFAWVCRKLGIDRLLFASDFPVDDPAEALSALTRYGFDQVELRSICHDNAVELFGLG